MGTRQLNRLSARALASKREPGLHCDGGGLYVQVAASGSKTWIFRYRSPLTRKLRDMGLGPVHSVSLPEAREKAGAQRTALRSGLDPIAARDEETQRKARSRLPLVIPRLGGTAFPHEVCEMALAHTIPNAAEAAYRRGDLFEKRAALMRAWAEFIGAPPQTATVVPLRSAA